MLNASKRDPVLLPPPRGRGSVATIDCKVCSHTVAAVKLPNRCDNCGNTLADTRKYRRRLSRMVVGFVLGWIVGVAVVFAVLFFDRK